MAVPIAMNDNTQIDESPTLFNPENTLPKGKRSGGANNILGAKAAGIKLDIVSSSLMGEEETTDVGSSASDSESTCSSTASSLGWPKCRQRTAFRGRFFSGTRLEMIPGTPVGRSKHLQDQQQQQELQSSPPPQHEPHVPMPPPPSTVPLAVKEAVPPPPPVHSPTQPEHTPTMQSVQTEPNSPKKRARMAVIAKARKEAIPLKVRLPKYSMLGTVPLNPSLPAKKRPIPEFASLTAMALQELKPGLPAKKRETFFLTEDTLRFLQTPPGLPMAPR